MKRKDKHSQNESCRLQYLAVQSNAQFTTAHYKNYITHITFQCTVVQYNKQLFNC